MTRRPLATLLLLFCTLSVGCMSAAYVQHPGAVNAFDSTSYDSVVTTKAIIDQAKTEINTNVFPAAVTTKVRTVLNTALIPAYNALDAAYLAYRMAVAANPNASQADVLAARDKVNAAVSSLSAAKVGQ